MSLETPQTILLSTNGVNQIAGAALFTDGLLVGAIREEYLSRLKGDTSSPSALAEQYLLESHGLTRSDVTQVVSVESRQRYREDIGSIAIDRNRAEAELAYWSSGFPPHVKTLIGVLDLGIDSSDSFWMAYSGKLEAISVPNPNRVIASYYLSLETILNQNLQNLNDLTIKQKFVEHLSDQPLTHIFSQVLRELVVLDELDDSIKVSPSFTASIQSIFEEKARLLGWQPVLDSFTCAAISYGFFLIRRILEEKLIQTNCTHLCMAGGLALSAELNSSILDSQLVSPDRYAVTPFPCGMASYVGAGLACLRQLSGDIEQTLRISWSKTYKDSEILATLITSNTRFEHCVSDEELAQRTAALIASGKIVAWFQNGAELGPRALGNRTILGSLTDPDSSSKLNLSKNSKLDKELAIATTDECARQIFSNYHFSPHMSFMQRYKDSVRDQWKHLPPAARPHTVTNSQNPLFWQLLAAVGQETGLAAVNKSSFNISGEPPAESPSHALSIFRQLNKIDVIAIGRYLVYR